MLMGTGGAGIYHSIKDCARIVTYTPLPSFHTAHSGCQRDPVVAAPQGRRGGRMYRGALSL
jgi:hypothetical protein